MALKFTLNKMQTIFRSNSHIPNSTKAITLSYWKSELDSADSNQHDTRKLGGSTNWPATWSHPDMSKIAT